MADREQNKKAPRNRTITLSDDEIALYRSGLKRLNRAASLAEIENCIINQDIFEAIDYLPAGFADLMFIDPPYNLNKSFNGRIFKRSSIDAYAEWIDSWLSKLVRVLKPAASVYICGDWFSSAALHLVAARYLKVKNRITWEREKGRGAGRNWKNCSEDIFFCTASDSYTFNADAVKLKKRVIAPYTDSSGAPKGWQRTGAGDFRLTHPSNLWNDITIPYWSMPENTEHPAQKPEKLLARIILASSSEGDMIFDPFSGSGTASVVAKKLRRRYVGIEIDEKYCCIAEKRLATAERDTRIQGLAGGVFWERNTLAYQKK